VSETAFSLRLLGPQDGPAYAAVLAASPDTGRIATAARFEIDAYQALMSIHKDTAGVVAETPGYDGFVGSGLVRFDQCQWEGEVRPSALLNALVVHPHFRRRGLACQLARWREEFARRRIGDGGVIWAIIQRSNTGSERTACKWAPQFLSRRVTIVPLRMRSVPPRRAAHLDVRPARAEDLEEVAEQLNRYYRDYNLYSPETKSSLAAWLAETPFDSPFRHYRVVTDGAGALLGGMGLSENFRVRTTLITRLPFVLRIPNRIFHVVPADGRLREVALSRIWYMPGRLDAMRYLLEMQRWEWRARGTSMVLYADLRSQLIRLLGLPERIGRTTVGIAVQAPVPCAQDRLVYYA
jgi:hypothetical protein